MVTRDNRWRLIGFLCPLLLLGGCETQKTRMKLCGDAALQDEKHSNSLIMKAKIEKVRVIVILQADPVKLDADRAGYIAEIQQRFISKLPVGDLVVNKQFKYTPGLVLTVGKDGLKHILQEKAVCSVTEDAVLELPGNVQQ